MKKFPSKKFIYIVQIDVTEKLTFEQEQELHKNIGESLNHTYRTAGLCPDDSDAYTENIEVISNQTQSTYIPDLLS